MRTYGHFFKNIRTTLFSHWLLNHVIIHITPIQWNQNCWLHQTKVLKLIFPYPTQIESSVNTGTLSIKNHWMNEDIPWSQCYTVKSLFNDWNFIHSTKTLLAQWLNFHSLNKDFILLHLEQGIFSFIQFFFFESVMLFKGILGLNAFSTNL